VASRTQIVCLHEGKKGRSVDPLFIRSLLKSLNPAWIRPWQGNNVVRTVDCGGRSDLIAKMPRELQQCLAMGADTTLMVWADADDNMEDCEQLKAAFWKTAKEAGITSEQFEGVVFAIAKDRIENWIQFLRTGTTDESIEGPRIKHGREAVEAAKLLATKCLSGSPIKDIPNSLEWSCKNWQKLKKHKSNS